MEKGLLGTSFLLIFLWKIRRAIADIRKQYITDMKWGGGGALILIHKLHMYEFLIILSYFWKFLTFTTLILQGFFNTDEVSLANEDGWGKIKRLSEGDYNMDSSYMICHTFKVSHYLEVLLTPLVRNTCRFPGPFTYTVLI